jgi:hypothetical protein
MLFVVGALLGFTPKNASSFMPNNHQQDVLVINASDTDTDETESEEAMMMNGRPDKTELLRSVDLLK